MSADQGPFNMILARNMETGVNERWYAGDGCYVQEPIFVPRTQDAAEGDGFLVAPTFNANTNLSDVVVLDAQNVASGPLAQIHLPTRIPYGFHGTFKGA